MEKFYVLTRYSFLGLCVISACGGGGGGSGDVSLPAMNSQPVIAARDAMSSTGYAKEGDMLQTGSEFVIKNAPQFVLEYVNGDLKIKREFSDVKVTQIKLDETGSTITVLLNGQEFTLENDDPDNPLSHYVSFLGRKVEADSLQFDTQYEHLSGAWYGIWDYDTSPLRLQQIEFNAGYGAVGFNTSPVDLVRRAAKASYSGDAIMSLRDDEYFDAFPSGQANFFVDFGKDTIMVLLFLTRSSALKIMNFTHPKL